MKVPLWLAIAAPLAIAATAGTRTSAASWTSPALPELLKTGDVIYVAELGNNLVAIYDEAPPHALLGQITNGVCDARNVATDRAGNLYVASDAGVCAENNIAIIEYAPGSSNPARFVTDGLTSPFALTVTPKGKIYASDYFDYNILAYAPNSASIENILYRLIPFPITLGLATDAAGTLYAAYYNYIEKRGHIARRTGGGHQLSDTSIVLTYPGALLFDPAGNLVASDQGAGTVDVFAPDSATPVHVYRGFGDPISIALNPATRRLFVADAVSSAITVLSYPDGRVIETFAVPDLNAIALSPAHDAAIP